ncbi:heme ABC exporter ATP-binding protein CcmA [Altericroceibacterium xinjiangense]|uniref:heme ABC exporter ATP-binding protein CcmA n=1 Tax=Altericroceibacterium xinjiangense TaxID=762261 RepID=UPI000F7EEDED|nr:heme ABC exporter ATP-binding protein CcmA [Altericroceibacterium xinjiangense]
MDGCSLVAKDLACLRGDRLLFRRLSLSLASGEALQVAGPNGTGKSSLIRILAGLLRPFAGTVERDGAIALLNERPALDEYLPLGHALGFWQTIDGPGAAVDRLGLADLLDVPVRYLSTGQRKRAALARLIGQRAPVWLLDEPLNGLDIDAAADCQRLVAEHCGDGGIAIVASHQPFTLPGGKLAIADYAP